jgi:metal-sulfur cluster biosynthetic enzyme
LLAAPMKEDRVDETVLNALSAIDGPEIGVNIVELGLVC